VPNEKPLKATRYDIDPDIIHLLFEKVAQAGIWNMFPHLCLNFNKTRFWALKAGRTKCWKLIVPNAFFKTLVFKEKMDSHFVIALCAISAAGHVPPPAFITKHKTQHSDSDRCSYIPNTRRCTTTKAFITRQVF
jgi:hypothetical protein